MTHSRLVVGGSFGHSTNTDFWPLGMGAEYTSSVTTETNAQVVYETAGILTNLGVNCIGFTSATVITTRSNAGGNATNLTVTLSGTGIVEDTTHTDTVAAGQKWDYELSPLASSFTSFAVTFAANSNTITRCICTVTSTAFNTASTNYFNTLAGTLTTVNTTTEANAKTRIRKAGIIQNMFANVVGDGQTNHGVITARVNGANPANGPSITMNGTTGILEDTTHTATVNVGDDANFQLANGTGTFSQNITIIGCDLLSTTGDSFNIYGQSGGAITLTSATTQFFTLSGASGGQTGGEANTQTTIRDPFTCSNLTGFVSANTQTSTTFTFRKNTGAGNQTITWGSSVVGIQSDTTNLDIVLPTDKVDYSGATGTASVTLTYVEVWSTLPVALPQGFINEQPYQIPPQSSPIWRVPNQVVPFNITVIFEEA